MKAKRSTQLATVCLLTAMAIAVPVMRTDAAVIYGFDYVITGTMPFGSPPWATLTIENYATNQVKFTLQANLQDSNEFITKLLLNVDPFVSVSLVPGSVSGGSTVNSVTVSENGFNNAGGEWFDLKIEFPTSGNRLTDTEWMSWRLQGTGLTENHFLAKSAKKQGQSFLPGTHYALLHVQGVGQNSGKLGAAVIPEPATLLLFGMGLAAPLLTRRRNGNRNLPEWAP